MFGGLSFHCSFLVLIYFTQMYPKDGSPLPLDGQLCFLPYLSSFLSISLLRRHLNVPSRVFPIYPDIVSLGQEISAERMFHIFAAFFTTLKISSQYLGPSPTQLVCLFIFIITNSVTLFALLVLLIRNIWVLGANVTTIEGWEIERHATLVRRAKVLGGYLDGPDGSRIRIATQEFPYDVGIFSNIQQGLGRNPLIWLWPFAATLDNELSLHFPTNGFEGKCYHGAPSAMQ